MEWLLDRIRTHGSAPFLAAGDEVSTYTQLVDAVAEARQHCGRAGIRRGDIVAITGDHSVASIAWLLALAAEDAVVVPITTRVPAEVTLRLQESGAAWMVDCAGDGGVKALSPGSAQQSPLLDQLRSRGVSGIILFSSGSSGRPKAMLHDLDALIGSYQNRRQRSLCILLFLMFDHIGGLNTLLGALAGGLLVAVPTSRSPEVVAAVVERMRVSVLPASPTFLNLMLVAGVTETYDLSSLRIITYGTEPMAESLMKRLRAAFPQVKLIQTFGTSETGIAQTRSLSSTSTLFRIDDPDYDLRVVDGELWLRSRTQTLGYLNHDNTAFTTDGWFRTGDLVEEHGDGYIRVVGRASELINVGGLKVTPAEVENVLLELEEIADCTVYAEPSPITGSIVAAQVVLAPGASMEGLKQRVRAHCRGRLDAYKVPVKIRQVEQTSFGDRFKKRRRGIGE